EAAAAPVAPAASTSTGADLAFGNESPAPEPEPSSASLYPSTLSPSEPISSSSSSSYSSVELSESPSSSPASDTCCAFSSASLSRLTPFTPITSAGCRTRQIPTTTSKVASLLIKLANTWRAWSVCTTIALGKTSAVLFFSTATTSSKEITSVVTHPKMLL